MDNLTPQVRREAMRRVKGKDTALEWLVRRLVHSLGYRYRLHRHDLPGCPDLVFSGRRAIIFVHGCFWHGHDCKAGRKQVKTNADYWRRKLNRNRVRDQEAQRALRRLGWRVLVVWGCQAKAKHRKKLSTRISRFLTRPH